MKTSSHSLSSQNHILRKILYRQNPIRLVLNHAILLILTLISLISASNSVLAKPVSTNSATVAELTILSGSDRMPGFIYIAAGEGPHPTVVFLHGYPGNERSLDVAQAARAAGWNAVYFNYRGAWGAEGEFSFMNAEADVQSTLKYLSNPDNAARLRIDPKQLSLVGHSMGGHMSVAGMLDNENVRCAVAYDGVTIGAWAVSDTLWSDYSDTLFMLKDWSGAKSITEVDAHRAKFDLVPRLRSLGERHLLILAADTQVIPIEQHITPIVEAVRQQSPSQLEYHVIQDDHSFSSNRKAVTELTISFLNRRCLANQE